jgi:hypothetical protein
MGGALAPWLLSGGLIVLAAGAAVGSVASAPRSPPIPGSSPAAESLAAAARATMAVSSFRCLVGWPPSV